MVILEDDGGKTCRLKLRKPHPHCFGTLIFPVSKMRVKTVSLTLDSMSCSTCLFYLHCRPDAAAFVWTVTVRTPEVGELRLKLVTLDESRMSASVKWNTWGTRPSAAALGAVLAGAVLSVCTRSAACPSRCDHPDVCIVAYFRGHAHERVWFSTRPRVVPSTSSDYFPQSRRVLLGKDAQF